MRRRWLPKFCVFLLLGAALNIAVAWGSSVIPIRRITMRWDGAHPSWPAPPRAGWTDPPYERISGEGVFQSWNAVTAVRISSSHGIELFTVALHQSGWPARAVECVDRTEGSSSKGTTWSSLEGAFLSNHRFPMHPFWPGFAINTLFYAGVCSLIFVAPFALRRLRGGRRIKRGLCPACAYPVGTSDLCTECGKPVTLQVASTSVNPAMEKAWHALEQDLFRRPYADVLSRVSQRDYATVWVDGIEYEGELDYKAIASGIAVLCLFGKKVSPAKVRLGSCRYYLVRPDGSWTPDKSVAF